MTEESVVVEADFCVEANEVVLIRHDQRIDLNQVRIFLDEQPVERFGQRPELLGKRALELKRRSQNPPMKIANARSRIDGERGDLLRGFGGHGLDIDPAFG